jgi:hypothetical protein
MLTRQQLTEIAARTEQAIEDAESMSLQDVVLYAGHAASDIISLLTMIDELVTATGVELPEDDEDE